MKQFYVFVLMGVLNSVLDLIDSAFGNYISIDSICVLASTVTLFRFVNMICRTGEYAYRIKMSNFTECLILEMLTTIPCAILFILLNKQISKLFDLTPEQYRLLGVCLIIKGLFLPATMFESFMYQYVLLTCQNKCILKANTVFWGSNIILDAVVILLKGNCYHLVLTTGIADTLTAIYYIKFAEYKLEKPELKNLLSVRRGVFDMTLERIMGRIAGVVVAVAASHLGTRLYAIQSVAHNITDSLYQTTDASLTYQLVKLKPIDNLKNRLNACKHNIRKTTPPIILIGYAIAIILLFAIHGKVSVLDALPVTLLYCTVLFIEPTANSYKGYLTSCEKTNILCLAGLISMCIKIPLSLLSVYTPLSIWGIALCDVGTSLICCVYYKVNSIKISKEGRG